MKTKKIILGKHYYYAKDRKKFKCVKVGEETSFFVDYKKRNYQFYNYDMYENRWLP